MRLLVLSLLLTSTPLLAADTGLDHGDDFDDDGWPDDVDCDPEDPAVFPGAVEVCDNEIDDDCDGAADRDDEDCPLLGCGDGGAALLLLPLIGLGRRRDPGSATR